MSTETEPSSSEVLAFKSGLCLAQAQERILDRSLLDNRKPGNIANENKFINSMLQSSNISKDIWTQ